MAALIVMGWVNIGLSPSRRNSLVCMLEAFFSFFPLSTSPVSTCSLGLEIPSNRIRIVVPRSEIPTTNFKYLFCEIPVEFHLLFPCWAHVAR